MVSTEDINKSIWGELSELTRLRESEVRMIISEGKMKWGVSFLDDFTSGLFPFDTALIVGDTGHGKTALANLLVMNFLRQKKKVVFFALEAFDGEIRARQRYRFLCEAYYRNKAVGDFQFLSFERYMANELEEVFAPYAEEVDYALSFLSEGLIPIYKDKATFTIEDFKTHYETYKHIADCFILDHLLFFDAYDNQTELSSMQEIIKTIREATIESHKAFVLITQYRKSQNQDHRLLMDLDDVYSSKHIVNTATRVITLANATNVQSNDSKKSPTYMRFLKNRWEGAISRYTALIDWNVADNQYEDQYYIGRLIKRGTGWEELEKSKWPQWAKQGKCKMTGVDSVERKDWND